MTFGEDRSRQLLAMPPKELYDLYIKNIASEYVLAKSERGKKTCFRLWTDSLKRDLWTVIK